MSSFSSASNLRGRLSASTSEGDLSSRRKTPDRFPREDTSDKRQYLNAQMRVVASNMDLIMDSEDDEADDEDEGYESDEIVASTFEYVVG